MKKKIFFSIITGIILIIFLELIFQMLAIALPSIDCQFLNRHCQISQPMKDEKLGVRPNPAHPEHDRNGFRNREVPNNISIVALGDSNTYGYFVTLEETWPKQLEMLGKATTYNMAFGRYGPVHSLILYEEAKSLNPKLIIEAFYAGNDLLDSYRMVYGRGQHPELKSTDLNILKSIAKAIGPHQIKPKIKRDTKKLQLRKSLNKWKRKVLNNSKLYGLCGTTVKIFKRKVKHVLQLLEIPLDFWYSYKWNTIKHYSEKIKQHQIFESEKFKTVFTSNERLMALNLKDPRIQEGLRISLEAIKEMNNRAAHDGINFIVLLIPTKELVFKDIVQQELFNMPQSYHDLIVNEELFWKRTKKYLQNHRIAFVDALPVMEEFQRNGDDPYMKEHHGHVNPVGYRAIAELINDHIKTYGLLNKR